MRGSSSPGKPEHWRLESVELRTIEHDIEDPDFDASQDDHIIID